MNILILTHPELIIEIIHKSRFQDFVSFCQCNRKLRPLIDREEIWKYFCSSNCDGDYWIITSYFDDMKISYRDIFKFFFIIYEFTENLLCSEFGFKYGTSPTNVLIRIILTHTNIKSLTGRIKLLTNLETINFSFNQIKIIPVEIANLSNLIHLDLSNNQIEIIPDEIGKLVNLKRIDLSYNKIMIIPKNIGSLVALEKFVISHNLIEIIPMELCLLTELQWLYLDNNRISEIPKELGNLVFYENCYGLTIILSICY
jgi:Leucine-rich repeat (LRR) protein